jgi:hypothetical protein
MAVTTFEGVVENGQIRLKTDVQLPEKTKVYVVVPSLEKKKIARIISPRLVHPEDMAALKKEMIEGVPDAQI